MIRVASDHEGGASEKVIVLEGKQRLKVRRAKHRENDRLKKQK
jgi:hypothetical protein